MSKGFTLIELLIVIAILAILATVVVLVLNPATILAETRDSQRVADLDTIRSAINLYLATVGGPTLQGGSGFTCGTNFGADKAGVGESFTGAPTISHAGVFAVDGSGWVAVPLNAFSPTPPIPVLPRDPVTTGTTYYYSYGCNNGSLIYELNANMESAKYASTNGTCTAPLNASDKECTDGGDVNTIYEIGTSLAI